MKPEVPETTLIAAISGALRRLLPPVDPASASGQGFVYLKRRNRGLDVISQVLAVAGVALGVLLPLAVRGKPLKMSLSDIGVLFGLAVALPTVFLVALAMLKGKPRLLEFLTYHSIRYHVDARNLLLFICGPGILVGMACAWVSYFA